MAYYNQEDVSNLEKRYEGLEFTYVPCDNIKEIKHPKKIHIIYPPIGYNTIIFCDQLKSKTCSRFSYPFFILYLSIANKLYQCKKRLIYNYFRFKLRHSKNKYIRTKKGLYFSTLNESKKYWNDNM